MLSFPSFRSFHRSWSILLGMILLSSLLGLFLTYTRLTSKLSECKQTSKPHEQYVVPNVIHYIHLASNTLPFISYVCVLSGLLNQQPERVVFHHDVPRHILLQDKYFRKLLSQYSNIEFSAVLRPTHVFGIPISSLFHATDILRLQLATTQGGIFLDQDTFVVRSLNELRYSEATIGWPKGQFIGSQALLFAPNSELSRQWLNTYRDYRPSMWYYNTGQLPTETILRKCPGLAHSEPLLLGVHDMTRLLYLENSPTWKIYFTIHLLSRHRTYLAANDVSETGIVEFNDENIVTYNRTFGTMARSVLTDEPR